ncbi:hypothetical protein GCM10023185_19020 [Hymenobacter saemangeumensis]|uniref:DUF72 domain-containing protein n=1 Tax=Hymenobacter saemangeumensis TaxID=1084522 RepID=A0ABP8ICB9_9BACT
MSDTPAALPSRADFACCYLYGVSPQPYRQSTDMAQFGQLYDLIIGEHGGLSVGSSFHPYQLLGPGGISVWYAAYAQLYAQPDRAELFAAITRDKARFLLAPPDSFADFHIWPDTRLTSVENPIFSRFIPFVLPFLVHKSEAALRWDEATAVAQAQPALFRSYLDTVNEALRFVQPAPAFVLGFDEFDEQQPERMIERFMSCRDLLLGI